MKFLMTGLLLILFPAFLPVQAQQAAPSVKHKRKKEETVHEGIASYYAEKSRGRKTHIDEVYNPDKLSGACNILPLRTWVKVTNLRNNKSVVLRINDRMNPRNKRLIDVSARAARELGFYARGLTRVRLEVLKGPPAKVEE
jgi:rare lipoprotein A